MKDRFRPKIEDRKPKIRSQQPRSRSRQTKQVITGKIFILLTMLLICLLPENKTSLVKPTPPPAKKTTLYSSTISIWLPENCTLSENSYNKTPNRKSKNNFLANQNTTKITNNCQKKKTTQRIPEKRTQATRPRLKITKHLAPLGKITAKIVTTKLTSSLPTEKKNRKEKAPF